MDWFLDELEQGKQRNVCRLFRGLRLGRATKPGTTPRSRNIYWKRWVDLIQLYYLLQSPGYLHQIPFYIGAKYQELIEPVPNPFRRPGGDAEIPKHQCHLFRRQKSESSKWNGRQLMPNVYIIPPAQMGGSFIVLLYLSSYFRLLMATESKAETPESWNSTNQDSFVSRLLSKTSVLEEHRTLRQSQIYMTKAGSSASGGLFIANIY